MPIRKKIKRTLLRKAKAHAYLGKRKVAKAATKAKRRRRKITLSPEASAAVIVGGGAVLGAGTSAAIAPKGRRKIAARDGALAGSVLGVPGGAAAGIYHRVKGKSCLLYTSDAADE